MSLDLQTGLRVIRAISRHGRENPIPAAALEEATGVNTRVIADIVSVAAGEGVDVASCGTGYFKWKNKAEKEEYLAREKKRLVSLGQKIAAIKKAANNPLTLWEQDSAA